MAALRFFARSGLRAITRPYQPAEGLTNLRPTVAQFQKRFSSYTTSPEYEGPENYTDFEISRDPKEWAYVENVLMQKVIPKPPEDLTLPSCWTPVTAKPNDYPYFVQRTKNHMQPVYLLRTHRGMRRITYIRRIHGDIWALETELKQYLETKHNKEIAAIVNELAGYIKFRGDYVSQVKEWMTKKGF